MRLLHRSLLVPAALGAVVIWVPEGWRRLPPARMLGRRFMSLMMFYAAALHMIRMPFPRYATSVQPMLFMMALLPVDWLALGAGSVG